MHRPPASREETGQPVISLLCSVLLLDVAAVLGQRIQDSLEVVPGLGQPLESVQELLGSDVLGQAVEDLAAGRVRRLEIETPPVSAFTPTKTRTFTGTPTPQPTSTRTP